MIGSTLSHYKITAELGRGGMGIVYKAQDTKLDRTVALKILPATTLSNDEDRARFYREAKAAAALHHPNIATVFEIDEAAPSDAPHGTQPSPFIAMEFVDGGSLQDEILKGPMALKTAVAIAAQVAKALKAAHTKDIVHRDIKGQNVMLTPDGNAKVLDFGLAKTAASTMLTRMGSTLGTAAYMSPEQARGEEVDHRTDIWSLGVVLYEMVSGRLPFPGEYEKAVMYGILNEDPEPLTAVRTGVPMGLEWIVSKMLAKKAEERYQSCDDLIVDLKTVDLDSPSMSRTTTSAARVSMVGSSKLEVASSRPEWMSWKTIVPGAVVMMILGGALTKLLTPTAPQLPIISQQFQLAIEGIESIAQLDVSEDGKLLVFAGQDSTSGYRTYIYDFETKTNRVLNDNAGDYYTFSPDNSELVYRDGANFYTIPVLGGISKQIGPFGSGVPIYARNGSIIFDRNESLWIANGDGSNQHQISQVDSTAGEGGHYNAYPLPGNRYFIFHITRTTGEGRQLGLLDLKTGKHTLLGLGASPRYIESGHIIFVDGSSASSGQLLIRPFDVKSRAWSGPPVELARSGGAYDFVLDGYGTRYFRGAWSGSGIGQIDVFVAINPTTGGEDALSLRGPYRNHRVSPVGSQISYSVDADENGVGEYLSIFSQDTGMEQRLTLDGRSNYSAWSSDGEYIYIEVNSKLEKWSNTSLQKMEAIPTEGLVSSFDVSGDESLVAYVNHDNQGFGNVHLVNRTGGSEAIILRGMYKDPRFSPDGKYISVSEYNPTRVIVYSLESESIAIATNATELAHGAVWGKNSDLYYRADSNRLMRLPVSLDGAFRPTARAQTAATPPAPFTMDISTNGDLLVHLLSDEVTNTRSKSFKLDITTNWLQIAKRLAPATER